MRGNYNERQLLQILQRFKLRMGDWFCEISNTIFGRYIECDHYHDRFLIIDDTVYHIGASLKDLGKRLFAFNRMEMGAEEILIWADRG